MKTSKFLNLNIDDFTKGFVVAVLTAILTYLLPALESGNYSFNWKQIGVSALTAGIAYLVKNLATNSNGQIGKE